jgi:hypothetical protein
VIHPTQDVLLAEAHEESPSLADVRPPVWRLLLKRWADDQSFT